MKPLEERIVSAKRAIRSHSIDGIVRRVAPMEIRELTELDGGGYRIEGHAAVFNDLSEDLGWTWDHWRERIEPGAFANVLKSKPDVRALFNHDPNYVLARTVSETLELEEDTTGLLFRANVAPTTYAADLRVLLERGDVSQCSFAFRVSKDSWMDDPDKEDWLIRTIEDFSELFDVSPVTYPAYPTTDVGLASGHRCAACEAFTETPSPDEEREGERAAATAPTTAEPGTADGATETLSREYVARDLEVLERIARA